MAGAVGENNSRSVCFFFLLFFSRFFKTAINKKKKKEIKGLAEGTEFMIEAQALTWGSHPLL